MKEDSCPKTVCTCQVIIYSQFQVWSCQEGHVKKGSSLLPDQCDPATQLQDGGIFGNHGMSLVDGSSFASACCNASFYSDAMDDGCNDLCTSQDDDNFHDQSFSTQGSNDTDDHSDDNSSDTQCDNVSADDVIVSLCS